MAGIYGGDWVNVPLPDTTLISSAVLAISAFAPGFIIVFIRNQLLTGRTKTVSELAAEYGLVSAIYYSSTLMFATEAFLSWESLFLTLFVVPAFVGLIIGVTSQKGCLRYLLGAYLKIDTVHPAPTAWDFVLGFKKDNLNR
jgi:hypothetical protein